MMTSSDITNLKTERQLKETQAKNSIFEKLIETGEKERLKELLRKRLTESGWRDEMQKYTKEIIKNRGLERVTVEELVKDITPKGRELVPDDVKAELLQEIRHFIETHE